MKKNNIVFYAFNDNNQAITKVIKCTISDAHDLFNAEYDRMRNNQSDYNYIDITSLNTGKLLRSYNNQH